MGKLRLHLPGRHSATNALAAVAVAHELEIPFTQVSDALSRFTGIHRRFEIKGEPNGILVIDDYGHHPTEIRATIGAIRDSWKRPLTVIFQPHRFTRTRDLFDEFLTAFEGADRLVLTEIYPAGEDPIPGMTGEALYQAIKRKGHLDVQFVPDKNDIVAQVAGELKQGDISLTLGAGDIYKVGEALVEKLQMTSWSGGVMEYGELVGPAHSSTPTLHWLEMFAMATANYDAPLAVELKLIAGLTVKIAEPLARYTSMKIGGPADYFIEVENEAALANLLSALSRHQ